MIDETTIDLARRFDIALIARAVPGLKRRGQEFTGPCPRCGGVDRFSINIRKVAWLCRQCRPRGGGDVIGLQMFLTDSPFRDTVLELAGGVPQAARHSATSSSARSRRSAATGLPGELVPCEVEDRERALAIWREARPIHSTPAWAHLIGRGVDMDELPGDMRHVLRWHPHCPWKDRRHSCMVALFTDAVTGKPQGIHRTAINTSGQKIDRMSLGPSRRCVLRIWPDHMITTGLVIGEGIETVLCAATRIAHRGAKLQPAWACGSDLNVKNLPALPGVEIMTILVDHDTNEAGQRAALECSARWTAAGREVIRLTPKIADEDFADIVGRAA